MNQPSMFCHRLRYKLCNSPLEGESKRSFSVSVGGNSRLYEAALAAHFTRTTLIDDANGFKIFMAEK